MRQAAEDGAARQILAAVGGGKITEEQRLLFPAVERIRLADSMRVDAQALDVMALDLSDAILLILHQPRRPQSDAAEGLLKVVDGLHGDGVDHLLMKARVRFGGREAGLGERGGMVEIDRRVGASGGRIDVDDLEVFADWTWL